MIDFDLRVMLEDLSEVISIKAEKMNCGFTSISTMMYQPR